MKKSQWHRMVDKLMICEDYIRPDGKFNIKKIQKEIAEQGGFLINKNTLNSYIIREAQRRNLKIANRKSSADLDAKYDPKAIKEFFDQNEQSKKDAKPEKKPALQNLEPKIINNDWDGCQKIEFGLMGDTQLGSKYAQITYLKSFYAELERRGIKTVYHTGDITDGIKMRPGHEYELYVTSADELKDHVVKVYPKHEGMKTYFITGNHDASLYKHVGYDIGKAISSERDDLIYLGRDCAVVNITPNCTLELRHPWDGTAYAHSYKIQKMIEAMEAGSKPNILAVGHYHKAENLFYRNVHAIQTACFQSQTPFTRGKGISVAMGGFIVSLLVSEKGEVRSIRTEYLPFYKAIPEDYKNYRETYE